MLAYHVLCRELDRMCKRAALHRVTSHELRHSATELWVNAGVRLLPEPPFKKLQAMTVDLGDIVDSSK